MEHISIIMGSIERYCPACHALPFQLCRSLSDPLKTVRYTHAERNR